MYKSLKLPLYYIDPLPSLGLQIRQEILHPALEEELNCSITEVDDMNTAQVRTVDLYY